MDIPYFTRLWSEGKAAKAAGKSFWDNRADEFNKLVSKGSPDARIRKIVEFLSHNCLLTENSSILDIGCGPGRFAVEFAKQSTDVTGLDISDKMLDYAVKNVEAANLTNVSFKNLNWDVFNILWLTGYYPSITYVDTDQEHVRTVEEACVYYGTLFETENNSGDEKNDLIKSYLDGISVNGFVIEKVRTKTAWIYWKV
jgi:SAM-dependent methyltransferase